MPSSQNEPRPRAGERRQLTVMFCDLVGSSQLAGELDPEDWNDILSDYRKTCRAVVTPFQAEVAEEQGDGLVVYFGWPVAHEDEAYRAVRAGLGIIDAMRTRNARLEPGEGVRLHVRIGIDTGTVIFAKSGEGQREGRATGIPLIVASRLQGIAKPDTVVISGTTSNLVRGYFTHEDLGLKHLKNIANPVQAYRVVAESGADHRLDAAGNRGLTPLIGRESELRDLLYLWDQAATGLSRVAFLKGEPGIGKSRLVKVLRENVESSIEFRCSPYDSHSALLPVIRSLERLLEFDQLEDPRKKIERLERRLQALGFAVAEIVPLLASQFSLPLPDRSLHLELSAEKTRQQTLQVLVDWLLKEAEREPLLAVWEDLHWADPSTIELLGLIIEGAVQNGTPLLTVITFRSGEFQPPWKAAVATTEIALDRLKRRDVKEMIRRITKSRFVPREVVDQIVEKANGLPLFAEELVQTVLDSGVVRNEGDRFVVTRPLSSIAIPARLEDFLRSRLDRLGTPEMLIAQRGAILGRAFSQDLMRAVLDADAGSLEESAAAWRRAEASLKELVEAGVLRKGRGAPTTYEFKHALIRDAAYKSLSNGDRRDYHLRTARVLEAEFPHIAETQPELVAQHYTKSLPLDRAVNYRQKLDPNSRQILEKALDCWQKAGERARDRSANEEAIDLFSQGLGILEALSDVEDRRPRELALRIASITPLIATRGYNTAETAKTVNRALELGRALGDVARLFPVLYGVWVNRLVGGKYAEALKLSEDFLREAAKSPDPVPRLMGHRLQGFSLFSTGELSSAGEHLQQSLNLYDPQRHRDLKYQGYAQDPRCACEAFMALLQWLRGYPDDALTWSRTSLIHAKEADHSNTWGYVVCFGGVTLDVFRRDVAAAERRAADLMKFSAKEKLPVWTAYARVLHGWALSQERRIEEGIEAMQTGLVDFADASAKMTASSSLHMGFMKSFLLSLLGEGYMRLGRPQDGFAQLDMASSFANATGEGFWKAEVQRLKGELLLRTGRRTDATLQEAETCFQTAREIASEQGAKALELRAAMSLSRLWARTKPLEARQILQNAYDVFTEGFDTVDLTDARRLLDELPVNSGA